jgi:hypothetical protein
MKIQHCEKRVVKVIENLKLTKVARMTFEIGQRIRQLNGNAIQ